MHANNTSTTFPRFVNEECSRVMKGKGDHCFKVIIHHKNSYAVTLITSDNLISTNGHNVRPFWAGQIKEKKA